MFCFPGSSFCLPLQYKYNCCVFKISNVQYFSVDPLKKNLLYFFSPPLQKCLAQLDLGHSKKCPGPNFIELPQQKILLKKIPAKQKGAGYQPQFVYVISYFLAGNLTLVRILLSCLYFLCSSSSEVRFHRTFQSINIPKLNKVLT